jgi:glutathione S-transferase
VSDDGFSRSISVSVARRIPGFVKCLVTPEKILKKQRQKLKDRVQAKYPEIVDDATAMAFLKDALKVLDDRLAGADAGYLCGTEHPTAADFGAYGILNHFVDCSGDANLPPSNPGLFEEAGTVKLAAFFARMKEAHPIVFKRKKDGAKK